MRKAEEVYGEIKKHKKFLIFALAVGCVVIFLTDVSIGSAWLSIREILSAVFLQGSNHMNKVIIWTIRLPMSLMALLVGASLGIAGAEMQTMLDNPLASPYTLGVAAGAGFGAALAIVLGVSAVPIVGEALVPVNAFFFALIACFGIYFLAKIKKASKEMMVLAGIAILFLFQSLLALLQYFASEDALRAIVFWLMGSLQKATWFKLGLLGIVLIPVSLLLAKNSWKLTSLRLGDERAEGLGVDVEGLRLKTMIAVSLLTAVAVSFTGTIGFVGLVGPHIARMLVGESQKFFLPASALAGSILLLAASVGTKVVIPGIIFPIGILTSLTGIPFFLGLILTRRGGYWES